jgi:hypothetical protein
MISKYLHLSNPCSFDVVTGVDMVPFDLTYRHHPGRSKWASNVVDIAGLVAFIGMAASVFYFGRLLGDSKDVQAMMMKEMREEKEAEIREVMKKRRSGLIKNSS